MLPNVDIVLPCYNPNERWVHELLAFYKVASETYNLHFIVVNDGSQLQNPQTHISYLQQRQIPLQYISYQNNQGKGHALRMGVKEASADLILYTDIDFPFENASMLGILNKLKSTNADVVAGYRNEMYYHNKMSLFRKVLSKSFRFFLKQIVRLPVSDTQCGLKAFNQNGKAVFLQTSINRYLFDFEFIYLCARKSNINLQTELVALKQNVVFSKMPIKVLLQEVRNLLRVLLKR